MHVFKVFQVFGVLCVFAWSVFQNTLNIQDILITQNTLNTQDILITQNTKHRTL